MSREYYVMLPLQLVIASHKPSLFSSLVTSSTYVTVYIWSKLVIKNADMIMLLQSLAIQLCRLFWHIFCHKVRQTAVDYIYKVHQVIQSTAGFKRSDKRYHKVRQILQSVAVITKWGVTSDVTLRLLLNMIGNAETNFFW